MGISASDTVYDAVRTAILNGSYPVGERLREEAIGEQLGVSRTPVREALRRLKADGLVDIPANRGAFVADGVTRELSEMYALRALVEGLGASLAAQRITDADLADLTRLCDDMETALISGDHVSYPLLNIEFHAAVAAASGSERLVRQLSSLTQVSLVSTAYSRLDPEHVRRSLHHHREIVSALQYRDSDWAEAIMRAHIFAAAATVAARD